MELPSSKKPDRRSKTPLDAAMFVLERLRAHEFRALLAGGCVRDMLLSRNPKDYDVVTDATPEQILEMLPHTRTVGAKFGVILVRKYGVDTEVATFRTDGTYSDGRHPDNVVFGSEIEDAHRRDFTINGLFYDPNTETVIDHIGGRADLHARIIRTIGQPACRFAEDHLRMLRAVRFAAALGFTIHEYTMVAIRSHAHRLASISAERIWQELAAVLTHPARVEGWSLLVSSNLRPHLVEGWPAAPQEDSAARRRLDALSAQPISPQLGLAAVICTDAARTRKHICRALRLSNKITDSVAYLSAALSQLKTRPLETADLKQLMASADWADALELLQSDLLARGVDTQLHADVVKRAGRIAPGDVAPPPLLTGDALLALGATQGPTFGEILRAVYRAQLNEKIQSVQSAEILARNLMGR